MMLEGVTDFYDDDDESKSDTDEKDDPQDTEKEYTEASAVCMYHSGWIRLNIATI